MNREIKFRGKEATTGEWKYGSLYVGQMKHGEEYALILTCNCDEELDENIDVAISFRYDETYPVVSPTIGQFTGLYDKNGERIYEGDIVKFPHVGECTRGIIVWNGKVGAWCIKLKGENSLGSTPVGEMLSSYKIEVIGNIHDNPELIKEEQQ